MRKTADAREFTSGEVGGLTKKLESLVATSETTRLSSHSTSHASSTAKVSYESLPALLAVGLRLLCACATLRE